MKKYLTETIHTTKIDCILCNICSADIVKNEHGYFQDYIGITKNWGYHSNYDGEIHNFDICQNCYENLLKIMKIKPDIS